MHRPYSKDCSLSQVQLFDGVPPTQVALDQGFWQNIPPNKNFEEDQLIFKAEKNSQLYTDLTETELYLIVALYKNNVLVDNTNTDLVGPINNFFHSLFSQIQVTFNDVLVENTNETYPYRAYIENTYCYDREYKETFLQKEGYYQDDPDQFDNKRIADVPSNGTERAQFANSAFVKRRNLLIKDGGFELVGKPHLNILNCPIYLLNNVTIEFTFKRADSGFVLLGTGSEKDYSLKIKKASLRLRRVEVNPSIMLHHALMLEKTSAKYPLRNVIVKTSTIAADSEDVEINDISNGQIPNRVLVAFVKGSAYSGSFAENAFKFHHYKIKEFTLTVGGQNLPYSSSLEVDFDKDNYQNAYNTLQQAIHDSPNNISYETYKKGFSLLAFDLTPGLCSDSTYNLIKTGPVCLKVKFAEKVKDIIKVVLYLESDKVIEINKLRNILVG
jgi:hypothetical protein